MSELTVSDVRFLENALRKYLQPVPRGLDPTFYHSGTYVGDCRIKEHAEEIAKKLGFNQPAPEVKG